MGVAGLWMRLAHRTSPRRKLIASFVDKIAALSPQLVTSLPGLGKILFFWTPGAMNGSTKVQSSQANSGCMLSGARRVHPVTSPPAVQKKTFCAVTPPVRLTKGAINTGEYWLMVSRISATSPTVRAVIDPVSCCVQFLRELPEAMRQGASIRDYH
jgi:hypothetical protein